MKTYIFAEKNGNASITLSAEDEDDAISYLEGITKSPLAWILDGEEEEEE